MAKGWISGDESAKEMLGRALKDRPLLMLPSPLNRVPLGVNNIVEILGPSPSAKSEILLQMAVTCILPKNRNGVEYGGMGLSVLFLDLDCRLDIFRLSQSLKLQITKAIRLHKVTNNQKDGEYEIEELNLFTECMKRFSYTRCYDSFEFLACLKVLHYKLEKDRSMDGSASGVRVLMIDNIGAFYWIDRVFSSLPQGNTSRKNICLQSVTEAVVQEIKKLLMLHPLLVVATKTVTSQVKSSYSSRVSIPLYREYMPSIWQSFVTHRILVRAADDKRKLNDRDSYLAEWLLPALKLTDQFVVDDNGITTLMRGLVN
uniref:DNA repair protein XRCC2 homolog n=1 Tax=Erigeron canadensis TaxID=72917 RepID=UPI001CB9D7A3|nr:DNA repair protein XRCC2 homolog [Erigeron canadensis]